MNLALLTEPTVLYTAPQELVLIFVKPFHTDSTKLEDYLYMLQASLKEDNVDSYINHIFRVVDIDDYEDICTHYAIDDHDAPHVVVLNDGEELHRTATLEHCLDMIDTIIDNDILKHT